MQRAKQIAIDFIPRGIFITATDSGVGKTIVTSALVACLTQRGIDVGVMKPIETGVSRHDPMAEVCPYVFRLSVAPLSAAWAERKSIRVATIIRAFHALCQKHPLVMVEGVGGLYVPITSSLHLLDLIYRMKLSAIVVGQSGLGGINQALLTLHALRQRKIPIVALVLNQCRPVLTKNARMQEQSTVTLLRRFAKVPVVGPLAYSPRVNTNWNDGLANIAETGPITKLAKLVLAAGRGTISQRG